MSAIEFADASAAHPVFTVLGNSAAARHLRYNVLRGRLQWSVPAFSVFLAAISLLYLRNRRRKESVQ